MVIKQLTFNSFPASIGRTNHQGSSSNICNCCRTGLGLQLEITESSRSKLIRFLYESGRDHLTDFFPYINLCVKFEKKISQRVLQLTPAASNRLRWKLAPAKSNWWFLFFVQYRQHLRYVSFNITTPSRKFKYPEHARSLCRL